MPNAAFALLLVVAGSLVVAAPSSAARLLMAGGWSDVSDGGALDVRCLLIPGASDLIVHLLSYGLLCAILAGGVTGAWTVLSERRRTERFVRRYLSRRVDDRGSLQRLAEQVGLVGRIDLVEALEPRCFCYELVQPRVVVTTGLVAMLSDTELEAILRHEAYHVRNYDPLRLLVGRALVAAFFFVPALRDLFAHYRLHVEVIADEQAVRQMHQVQSLAAALDKLLDAETASPMLLPAIAGASSLELRIDHLLGEPVQASIRTPTPRLAVSLLLVLLVAAPALASVAVGEPGLLVALAAAPHPSC